MQLPTNRLSELGHRLVIAHRGASSELAENTLPAFARALELGADALELDVRLARDGAAVVIHDATVDRTTTRSGPVASFDARQLAALGVPAFADVVEAFPEAELLVEIKEGAAQAAVDRAIADAGAERRCVVAAAAGVSLGTSTGRGAARCGGRPDVAALRWRSALGLRSGPPSYRTLSVPRSYRGIPVATQAFFRAAAAIGVPVHVWTVDDPRVAAMLWRAGASGIVTNDVRALVKARREAGLAS
jgi:glycerophosphoryl diester phosphodiesterase